MNLRNIYIWIRIKKIARFSRRNGMAAFTLFQIIMRNERLRTRTRNCKKTELENPRDIFYAKNND